MQVANLDTIIKIELVIVLACPSQLRSMPVLHLVCEFRGSRLGANYPDTGALISPLTKSALDASALV